MHFIGEEGRGDEERESGEPSEEAAEGRSHARRGTPEAGGGSERRPHHRRSREGAKS
ncbi:hypothetical protein A7982_12017 [Minicystis rosea]|nr:hypothetical protein A7982_12017 [Minicystis rosea]